MSDERAERNQVFTGGNPGGIQSTTAVGQAKADFGLDIPVETIPLPSNGRVYPTSSPCHGKTELQVRAMTAREEDILTSSALLKKGTVITELIKSCLIDKSIDPADLLNGDRNALMVAIRITGYGPEYDAELQCAECDNKGQRAFNLAELPIRRLTIEPVSEGMNLFEFKLPYCGKTVRFRFLTGRDEETILATQAKQKKLAMSQTDSSVTTNLLYSIVSIDGVEDRGKIANFVRVMPARDSLALRNYIRDNEPGIIMRQEASCPSCGHEEEVAIPLGVNFLWPNAVR